jgi:hypothetical protein
MGIAQWMRVLDTVSGLVQMTGRMRRPPDDLASTGSGGPLGQLETRLAGVVVAALKEAFDRDRARMDLERSQMEGERRRAEQALRAELQRQAAERSLGQLRLIAVMAFVVLMVSAALGVWLPGMRTNWPRLLMGGGWLAAISAVGCAFAAWQHVSSWTASGAASVPPGGQLGMPTPEAGIAVAVAPHHAAAPAALWLLLSSLALTLAALLLAL